MYRKVGEVAAVHFLYFLSKSKPVVQSYGQKTVFLNLSGSLLVPITPLNCPKKPRERLAEGRGSKELHSDQVWSRSDHREP